MRVLAIDGALGAFSAAVAEGGRIVAERTAPGKQALEHGLETVRDVLAEAGLAGAEVDRIAAGCGPGGFTGLRIALSYAKALALAWRRPLVPVSSFDILEYGLDLGEPALTVVVGRPGVISVRLRAGAQRRASGRVADVLDELFTTDTQQPLAVVGAPKDVLAALAERGTIVRAFEPMSMQPAAVAALLAGTRAPADSAHAVRADYGELPAAKVPKL